MPDPASMISPHKRGGREMPQLREFQQGEMCERSGLYAGVASDGKLVGTATKIERNAAFGPPPAGAEAWVLYRADPAWTGGHSAWLGLSLFLALVSFVLFYILKRDWKVLLVWAVDFAAVAILLVNFAHAITGYRAGWLINTQNRMSLSRLQMFLWMVVVMSGFLTALLANLFTGARGREALAIQVPELLWLAMGISTTSLVGSGLILDNKKKKDPSDEEMENLVVSRELVGPLDVEEARMTDAQVEGRPNEKTKRAEARQKVQEAVQKVKDKELNGVLVINETIADASPTDLMTGEELGNKSVLEPTRFFNLIVTLILVGVYAVNLGVMLVSAAFSKDGVTAFPELGTASATLLTLSHAGYLADKVPDKQETNS
jgi:hypothetical protein